MPLRNELVGSARPALLGAAAAAVLLLVIVGANIAGLSTAHAAATTHHVAVRAALGATRGRLFAEQLAEILVLVLTGSLLGLWLATVIVQIDNGGSARGEQIAVTEDLTITYLGERDQDYPFRVYECVALRIKRPSAICTIE